MFIDRQSAEAIVTEMKRFIHRDINIMDRQGVILASTNPARTGQLHEGAARLLREGLPSLTITEPAGMAGVQQGVNLPVALQGETVGVIGITGDPAEVAVFGEILQKMTEILLESAQQTAQEAQLDYARGLFLENWLFAEPLDTAELEMRGKLLGIDTALPRTVVLLQVQSRQGAAQPQELQSSGLLQLIRGRIGSNPQEFCSAVHQRILILLANREVREVRQLTGRLCQEIESFYPVELCAGISTVAQSAMELRRCYLEAKTAGRVAARSHRSRVAFYSDVSLEFIVQSIEPDIRKNLQRLVFGRCTKRELNEILKTLGLYFQYDGSVERAAAACFIHKNTFLYRMGKVREKTGYSLRKPRDAVLLYLAAQFAQEG